MTAEQQFATPSTARARHLLVKNGNGEGGHAKRSGRDAGNCRSISIYFTSQRFGLRCLSIEIEVRR
jgi:hypothetical protein